MRIGVEMLAGREQTRALLTFRLGEQRYALPIATVIEVAAMVAVDRLPDSDPALLGMANRRGQVLPVLDLRIAFGLNDAPIDVTTLFIVVAVDEQMAALVVDQIEQVIYIANVDLRTAAGGRYTQAVVRYDEHLYQIMAIERLIADYFKPTEEL